MFPLLIIQTEFLKIGAGKLESLRYLLVICTELMSISTLYTIIKNWKS